MCSLKKIQLFLFQFLIIRAQNAEETTRYLTFYFNLKLTTVIRAKSMFNTTRCNNVRWRRIQVVHCV